MSNVIYLASQSPRRRQLLEQIGVRFEMLLAGDDEDVESLEDERPGEAPAAYVERVTLAKLDAACARWRRRGLPAAPILCADTTVALGDRIFGKPGDAAGAREALLALSGAAHDVLTAVAVAMVGDTAGTIDRILFALNRSTVTLADVDAADIDAYIASGDVYGKAGSYAIQSRAAAWVRHIEGSYSGIMGLPLFETAQLLKQAGVQF